MAQIVKPDVREPGVLAANLKRLRERTRVEGLAVEPGEDEIAVDFGVPDDLALEQLRLAV